jgi:hypothetical protein
MKLISYICQSVVTACLIASPALAADTSQNAGTVHRLSADQIDAIARTQADRDSEAAPLGYANEIGETTPKPKIHGEIGFGIGTGGYSEVFGTVDTPLGQDGYLALSFAQSNGGNYYRRGRR